MSDIILYLECEDYLRQWIVHECGGTVPVRLKKGSPESIFLEMALQNKAVSSGADFRSPSSLAIVIPEFRHKPPQFYNHLSQKSRNALLKILRRRFDLALWSDLMKLTEFFSRKDELIASWAEAHGIEDSEKNILAVTKRLQRLSDRMKAPARMKKSRKR